MSEIKNENFSESFEKAKKDWLNNEEKQKLKELFLKLPKDRQEDILQKYNNLKNEPEKSFFDWLKNNLNSLKQDVEQNNSIETFSSLEKEFEKNESMKEILDMFWGYLDLKLDYSFSSSEKEIIKLALFWEIEKKMNFSWMAELALNKILSPIKNLINKFKKNKTWDIKTKDLENISKEFDGFWEKFGISGISEIIDAKINIVNEAKKANKKFEKIDDILWITNPSEVWKINKKTILENTKKLAETLKKWKTVWDNIKEGLKNMPFWETIISWLKDFAKSNPIIWFFLSLFFWKDFLSEWGDKSKTSLENLSKFSESSDFILKDNIKTEELKKLDPKKLEKFYKFLDSKDIDYTSETFWQELLTWESKDKKVIELYNLLKNKDWKILDKNEKLEDFVKKLNLLEKKQEEKENKEREEKTKKVNSALKDISKVAWITWFAKTTKQQLELKSEQTEVQPKTQTELKSEQTEVQPKTQTESKPELKPELKEVNKIELLQKDLQNTKISDFFAENFDLSKYNIIKLWNNISLGNYRDSLIKSYESFPEIFAWIKTFWDLLKHNDEIIWKIKKLKEKQDYINNLTVDILKKDLKFNNWIFELPHWIRFKYKVEFIKRWKLEPEVKKKTEVIINSISIKNHQMTFNLNWIVTIGGLTEKDLSKKPSIIKDDELIPVIKNINNKKIKIKIITKIWYVWNFVLEKI